MTTCTYVILFACMLLFFFFLVCCVHPLLRVYPVCGWTLVLQQLKLHFCSNFVFYIAAVLVGFRVLQSGIPQERHTKKKLNSKWIMWTGMNIVDAMDMGRMNSWQRQWKPCHSKSIYSVGAQSRLCIGQANAMRKKNVRLHRCRTAPLRVSYVMNVCCACCNAFATLPLFGAFRAAPKRERAALVLFMATSWPVRPVETWCLCEMAWSLSSARRGLVVWVDHATRVSTGDDIILAIW